MANHESPKNSKRKGTKAALAASFAALLLCGATLVGTTFAWFTDTASTGNNTIQAGTLNIDLDYKNVTNGQWETNFSEAEGVPIFNSTLWEPGRVEAKIFKVTNEGNLALKWKTQISRTGGTLGKNGEDLADVIDVYINVPNPQIGGTIAVPETREDLQSNWTYFGTLKEYMDGKVDTTMGSLAHNGNFAELGFALAMQTNAGNAYQGLSLGDVTVSIVATQDTVESDSFDNKYDEGAEIPVLVATQGELNTAIADGASNIALSAGTYTIPQNGAKNKEITLTGSGSNTVINVQISQNEKLDYGFDDSTVTFENLVITTDTSLHKNNYPGFARMNATYNNCTFTGTYTLYGNSTFNNCTFNTITEDTYNIKTWGAANVIFNNCTFNCDGKALLLYASSKPTNLHTNLTVNHCTFNDSNNGTRNKAAIEIGNDYQNSYTIVINNITVTGFSNTANSDTTKNPNNIPTQTNIWSNKTGMGKDKLSVTIDGVAQTTGIKQ